MEVLALMALAALLQDPTPAPPPARAEVEALEDALRRDGTAERVAALRNLGKLESPELVAVVARALEDRESDVRVQAVEVLARAKAPAAFDALLEYHARHRKERKDEKLLPKLLQAVARRGDERAVEVLADDVQGQMKPATRARLLGLGWVRSKKSGDALLRVMKDIGFAEQLQYLEDFRLAFVVLSGSDRGKSFDAWSSWWAKEREAIQLPREMPKLATSDLERWNSFWGIKPPPPPRAR